MRHSTWNCDPASKECPGAKCPVLPSPDSGEWEDLLKGFHQQQHSSVQTFF